MLHLESKLYKGKTVSSLSIGLLGLHLTLGSYVIANPTGGNVTHGNASISSAGSTLNVNQLTDKAIINWNSFSIAQGETTQFNQPSASSAVLNRVVGGDISKIYGNLKANGQVFLINGNGVLIGESGVIDTAGFLATTHSIKDADFLNGGDLVLEPGKNLKGASIINLGKISASGGDIFLIADHVTNEGIIDASNGSAGLAAARGSRVLLAESGDQRIFIQPSTAAKTDKDGVINKGTIKAVNAEIKAAGGNIYALAINNDGVVRATGVQKKGGRILLTSKNGKIKLGKNSRLNASGKKGGGKINVGGNKQGKGDVAIAKSITTEKGSKLTADAIESGNGGSIIVFAEGNTTIAGDFSAQGGALSGDGGFIETSGKQNLLVANGTQVNTSAANGVSGTWLLDPTNFTISAGSAASTNSGIGADTLVSNLGMSNVILQTDAAGSEAGDIFVNGAVSWDSANSLTLQSHRDITVSEAITNAGTGDITLTAGNGANGGGGSNGARGGNITISTGANISTLGGITLTAGNGGFAGVGLGGNGGNGGNGGAGGAGGALTVMAGLNSGAAMSLTTGLGGVGGDGGDGVGLGGNGGNGGAGGALTVMAGLNSGAAMSLTTGLGGVGGVGGVADIGGNGGNGGNGGALTVSAALHSEAGMTLTAGDAGFGGGGGGGFVVVVGGAGGAGGAAGTVNGSIDARSTGGDLTVTGEIIPTTGSNLTLHAGTQVGDTLTLSHSIPALTGTGALSLRGYGYSPTTALSAAGGITIDAGDGDMELGHALRSSAGSIALKAGGNIDVNTGFGPTVADGQSLSLLAGGNLTFNTSVQLDSTAELNLIAGWDGTTAFNATTFDAVDVNGTASLYGNNDGSIFIGTGAQTSGIAVASRNGTTRAYGHDLSILAGTGANGRYAQLGFQVSDQGDGYSISGDINARVLHNITATGGAGNDYNYAQLGHIGADQTFDGNVEAAVEASISIAAGNNLSFVGGGGFSAYSQLGHGGENADGDHSGEIRITSANDLSFMGGGGVRAYSQLGHGGFGADGIHSGDITITSANDLSFMAGGGDEAYSQLGHGGALADGDHSGEIRITSANDLSFMAGGGDRAYSQLGHGGVFADGDHSGTVVITSANDLSFMAGGGIDAYSQLGHGGAFADGDHSGTVVITSSNDLSFMAGAGSRAYSQLGHGGADASGTREGNITVASTGEWSLVNGTGGSWVIGHITASGAAVSNANIQLTAGSIDYSTATTSDDATINSNFAAQVGRLIAGGDVTLNVTGANGNDGKLSIDGALSFSATNNLTITSTKDLSFTANGAIHNTATGEVVLSTKVFTNNGVADNITTANGQTLIYSDDWDADNRGTLTGYKNLYNRSFSSNGPTSTEFTTGGNHATDDYYIYSRQPELTVRANDVGGTYNGTAFSSAGSSITGLVNGDAATEAYTGTASVSGSGTNAGTHILTASQGTLSAFDVGYKFKFENGTLTINKASLTITGVSAQNKVYDANTVAGLTTGSLSGVFGSDTVTLNQGSGAFADNNVGTGKTVTASGFAISGADAGNYNLVSQPSSLSASITPRALVITANDATRVFGSGITHSGSVTGLIAADGIGVDFESSSTLSTLSGFYAAGTPFAVRPVLTDPNSRLSNYTVSLAEGSLLITNTARETQSEDFWSWVSREGEFLGGASPELIEFHYFKGDLQQLRHLLNLEQQSKKGTREMTEEERGKLKELLSSQPSVASSQ